MDPFANLWLAVLALGAAFINGAIGYGFSSIVTPIAVIWYSNKVLNPALVIVELVVNITLLVKERKYIRATFHRASPVAMTLLPGVILGTIGLTYLAVNDVKVAVYATLLPLAAIQLLGIKRPFKDEKRGGMSIGPGIGFLYALTTISGPPLAIFLRNQGLSKEEFRCAIAQIRVAESGLTLAVYSLFTVFFGANLVAAPSVALLPYLFIPVLIGVPLGALLLRSISKDSFLRLVMAADGAIVSYGLSAVLAKLKWISTASSYLLMVFLFAIVAGLTYISLTRLARAQSGDPPQPTAEETAGPPDPDPG
ncbi:MAG TPA: sulfite exporter TauE/SafE family protein [Thermoplasmata archaeon]|nr:sulfite exporter TauE/SafE family protein [Thermoplasmata archaeon]